MTKKPSARNNLVIKGNDFINARHQLSVAEMRIVLTMIAQIGRDDVAFKPYRIYIKDFVDAVGTSHKGEYERARAITLNLMKRVMEIPKEDGYLQVSFLSSAEYKRGTGYVELSFDPKLKPYLLQLKERFTQYDIRNVLSLQSFYSIRIYELLKQFIKLGERVMGIDELKKLLRLPPSYDHYASFKRRIILQAQRDLEQHTDISFNFEELKTGRKITRIRFVIQTAGKRPHNEGVETGGARTASRTSDFAKEPGSPLLNRLIDEFGLTIAQAEAVLANYPGAYIQENLAVVASRYERGSVKELTPYTLKALADDFRKKETGSERKRREKQKAAELAFEEQKSVEHGQDLLILEFERARDRELAQLRLERAGEELSEGFLEYLTSANKFALDFARREVLKQGRPFVLSEHLAHPLMEATYKTFLAKKYLPSEFHAIEMWLEKGRP